MAHLAVPQADPGKPQSPMSPSVPIFGDDTEVQQGGSKHTQADFNVERLPGANYPSPLAGIYPVREHYRKIIYQSTLGSSFDPLGFDMAGPHARLHFNPAETTVGIVTCGGLCPGLNDVVRELTIFALNVYKVKRVIGFKYGYRGLRDVGIGDAIDLTPAVVDQINQMGGSFLGSSRGHAPDKYADEMLRNLEKLGVNILFTVGGDGTQKGSLTLKDVAMKQNKNISFVGVPKTIDNDVAFIQKTFGFETAVNESLVALSAAWAEAKSAMNGVGIVKLMGRSSGFIAAKAALSFGSVHIVLIPEKQIALDVVLQLVDRRLQHDTYCVVVVAEGFGQDYFPDLGTDASGNKKLGDIGVFLKEKIDEHMKKKYSDYTVKYIDPSYMIRSCVATGADACFCLQLANFAVHEAMFGSTGCLIGFWNNNFTAVPIKLCVSKRKMVNLNGDLWRSVREITVSLTDSKLVEQDYKDAEAASVEDLG